MTAHSIFIHVATAGDAGVTLLYFVSHRVGEIDAVVDHQISGRNEKHCNDRSEDSIKRIDWSQNRVALSDDGAHLREHCAWKKKQECHWDEQFISYSVPYIAWINREVIEEHSSKVDGAGCLVAFEVGEAVGGGRCFDGADCVFHPHPALGIECFFQHHVVVETLDCLKLRIRNRISKSSHLILLDCFITPCRNLRRLTLINSCRPFVYGTGVGSDGAGTLRFAVGDDITSVELFCPLVAFEVIFANRPGGAGVGIGASRLSRLRHRLWCRHRCNHRRCKNCCC